MMILKTILFLLFLSISILHFYWAFGGKKSLNKAIPTKSNTQKPIHPSFFATIIVAFGLLYFALYYLPFSIIDINPFPNFISKYLGWFTSTIFIVRAIGDFKYVGYFKKIKNTEFAKFDSKYFSHFSLVLGCLALIIELLKH